MLKLLKITMICALAIEAHAQIEPTIPLGVKPVQIQPVKIQHPMGFRCEVLGGGDSRQYKSVSVKRESGLGRKSEQCADEVSLADHISISQPSHSALPDHVHGLDTLQRPPRTLKGSIALGQPNSLFHRPVVLFNHVIEILALA